MHQCYEQSGKGDKGRSYLFRTIREHTSDNLTTCSVFSKIPTAGFPGGSVVKNPPANAGDTGLIPESGRPSGEGNGNLLRCSRLGNPMNRGAWWATVCRVAIVRQDLKTKQHKRELPREVRKRLPLPVRMKKGRGDCCLSSQ